MTHAQLLLRCGHDPPPWARCRRKLTPLGAELRPSACLWRRSRLVIWHLWLCPACDLVLPVLDEQDSLGRTYKYSDSIRPRRRTP